MSIKKALGVLFPLLLMFSLVLTGCGSETSDNINSSNDESYSDTSDVYESEMTRDSDVHTTATENKGNLTAPTEIKTAPITLADIPEATDEEELYVEINGNEPFFETDEITTTSWQYYSDLDSLGRVQTAMACLGQDLMPTEKRGNISEVHPTGWIQNKYDFVDGESLYNRSHLIAYELTGQNANEKNLMTGTRRFNAQAMQIFENLTTDYIKETNNHVMYRVTPMFDGDNLLANGVLMEGYSIEDEGDGVLFCVFCYNQEPGVVIDYATGNNWAAEEKAA